MGGRGTFAIGKNVPQTYETVGKINGVKILEKIDKNASKNLPEESHSSKSYVLLENGVFKKYREYNKKHILQFEIEYGVHNGKKYLHYHPYIKGERQKAQDISAKMKEKYKKYFRGLEI